MILVIHDLIENEKIKHVIDHEIDENGIIKYKLNGENYTLEVKDKEIIQKEARGKQLLHTREPCTLPSGLHKIFGRNFVGQKKWHDNI